MKSGTLVVAEIVDGKTQRWMRTGQTLTEWQEVFVGLGKLVRETSMDKPGITAYKLTVLGQSDRFFAVENPPEKLSDGSSPVAVSDGGVYEPSDEAVQTC
jgi:hypothetical protein